MNIAVITWEYPPRIVGGIAKHCEGLAEALANLGHEVHIFTLDFPGAPDYEETKGIRIYRSKSELGHPNFLTWVLLFNHYIEKRIADVSQTVDFDVLHVHDWLTAPACIAFKHFSKKPMVFTAHSTEHGRSGLQTPDSLTIDGLEWWATYEARKIIITSDSMKHEVGEHFHVPWEKMDIIPNAIDHSRYEVPFDRWAVRSRYGVQPHEKLVLCVGRLVPQKGIEHFIYSTQMVAQRHPESKFIIAGDGWYRDYLERVTNATRQRSRTTFTGFVPDSDLVTLTKSADVMVVPSIYEPFGIVALEGMAAGVPVVASRIGGLMEFLEHDRTGVLVYPRNPESIAWGIDYVLSNPDHAKWMARNAHEVVQRTYTWEAVAKKTSQMYEEVTEVKKK
jgi:glycogen synthase